MPSDLHEELYEELLQLCQQYGCTTARTSDLLHTAIDSILFFDEQGAVDDDEEPLYVG